MKILTSYYAKTKTLDPSIYALISISGKAPDGWNYHKMKELAPSWDIWSEWRCARDFAEREPELEIETRMKMKADQRYIDRFKTEILGKLDPHEVVEKIRAVAAGRMPVLICYETPEKFCHRHLVADWLNCYSDTMFHNCFGIDTDIKVEELR